MPTLSTSGRRGPRTVRLVGRRRRPSRWPRRTTAGGRPATPAAGSPGDGEVDYGFLLDDDRRASGPTRGPAGSPTGVHGPSRTLRPVDAIAWADAAWTGRQLAGSVIYELHVGTFTPEGTLDAALGKLDHLVVDRRRPGRAAAGQRVQRHPQLGLRRRALVRRAGELRRPARPTSGSSTPATSAGLGVIQDVVYNHLGPSGNYLPRFGPYLNDEGRSNTWGDSVNLDGAGSGEVRRYILDNVRDVAARLPRRRAAARRRARAGRRPAPCTCWRRSPIEVDALSAHVRPAADADRRVRPQRPAADHARGRPAATGWTRSGATTSTTSLHVALTGETDGYYADFGPLSAHRQGAATQGVLPRRHLLQSSAAATTAVPVDTRGTPDLAVRRCTRQNHDQVGNRAVGDRLTAHAVDDRAGHRRGAGADRPVHPDAVHGRGVGGVDAVAVLHLAPRAGAGRGHRRGPDRGVRPDGLGPGRWCPTRRTRATFQRSKLDWSRARESASTPGCSSCTGDLAALRRARAELTDPWFSGVRVDFDDDQRWLLIDRSGVRIAVNFSDDDRVDPAGRIERAGASGNPGRRSTRR